MFRTHECTLSHQRGVCKVSDIYLLGCLRYLEEYVNLTSLLVVVYKHGIEIYMEDMG